MSTELHASITKIGGLGAVLLKPGACRQNARGTTPRGDAKYVLIL